MEGGAQPRSAAGMTRADGDDTKAPRRVIPTSPIIAVRHHIWKSGFSGDFLYSGFVRFDYNGEWLENDRVPVVDPFGFCSLASLAFPPTGAARAAFRMRPEL